MSLIIAKEVCDVVATSLLLGRRQPEPAPTHPILSSAVLLAGYVPARKASRIDPVTALRID